MRTATAHRLVDLVGGKIKRQLRKEMQAGGKIKTARHKEMQVVGRIKTLVRKEIQVGGRIKMVRKDMVDGKTQTPLRKEMRVAGRIRTPSLKEIQVDGEALNPRLLRQIGTIPTIGNRETHLVEVVEVVDAPPYQLPRSQDM